MNSHVEAASSPMSYSTFKSRKKAAKKKRYIRKAKTLFMCYWIDLSCEMFVNRNNCTCSSQDTGFSLVRDTPLTVLISSFPHLPPPHLGSAAHPPRSHWDINHWEKTSPRSHLCIGSHYCGPGDWLWGSSFSEATSPMWPPRHLAEAEETMLVLQELWPLGGKRRETLSEGPKSGTGSPWLGQDLGNFLL